MSGSIDGSRRISQRIAIVGNGAVGLTLAYKLARSASAPEVVVFGPEDLPGSYAGTTAAPAMVNVIGEITTKIRSSWAARHLLEIGEHAMQLWPELTDSLNEELAGEAVPRVNLHHGTYILCRPDAEDERLNLQAIEQTLAERGRLFEELDLSSPLPHAVVEPERFERGIFVPEEMFVNTGKLVMALQAALTRRQNVEFRPAMVDRVDADTRSIRHGGRDERFDGVVLANAFGFNELVNTLGNVTVPLIIPVFGVGMTLPVQSEEPFAVRTPVYGASCGDYAVHYPGHLYVGASAVAHTNRVEVSSHLQRSLDFFDPHANLNEVSLSGGIRAMSQDTYPVIGELVPGIWAAAGFYKSGITLAPYTAELLAREILGEPQVYENRFLPTRNTGEEPPSAGELAETICNEIAASGSSSGSRAAIENYRWLVKLLVRWKAGRTIRSLERDVYYNSDIIQSCILDRSLIDRLNRHRPPQEAAQPAGR